MPKVKNKSNIQIVKDYLAGERPFVQVGYTGKKYIKRKVGDIWEEGGKTWIQTEHGPQTYSRIGNIVREALNQKCKCGQEIRWGSRLDELFFRKTGMCENCLVEYETKLRILGIWHNYEMTKLTSNELAAMKDMKSKIEETIKYFNENSGDVQMLCNSEGFTERWKMNDVSKILEDANNDLIEVNVRIEKLTEAKDHFKKLHHEDAHKYNLETYV